jgi:hypothetical protein
MTAVASEPPPNWLVIRNRALSLAQKGYHVFPVRVHVDPVTGANTKTYVTGQKDSPIGAKWNATTDPELIRTWWADGSRFADCTIGIATEPSGVVLLDLDTKHDQDGPGEWAKLHPEPYPLPAAVGRSSTGGVHLPYRANPKRPVKTCAGELAPAVDVRGVGGMFVCWSTWLPAVKELPIVPDVVPDRVPFVENKPKRTVIPIGDGHPAGVDEVRARVLEHRDIIAAARDGEGTPTASRQAYFVGQYVGAGQIEEQWAIGVLLDAVSGWTWHRRDDEAKMHAQIIKGVHDGMAEPRAWVTEPELATVTVLHPRSTAPATYVRSTPPAATPAPSVPPVSLPPQPPLPPATADSRSGPSELAVELSPDEDAGPTVPGRQGGAQPLPHGKDEVPVRRLRLTSAAEITPKRVRWLWAGRWALGSLTIVAGEPGLGKSTIVYDRSARITRGELEGELAGQARAVFVCATEDSWEYTIVPRLMAAGADLDLIKRVDVLDEDFVTGLVLPRDIPAIAEAAAEYQAAALVLDPLTSRVQSGLDTHKDSETRRALEPLAALADSCSLTVVGLMHLNKGGGTNPLTALNGSTAFAGVARSVSFAMFDPDDEDRRRKLFGTPKNNLGRSDLATLVFRTVGVDVPIPGEEEPANVGRIEWLEEVEGSIGDAMERAQQDPETRTAIGDAAAWLSDYLSRCGGQADSAAIKDAGRGDGHNAKTLSRALRKLGGRAESIKDSFPRRTLWALPTKTPKPLHIDSEDSQSGHTPRSTFTVSTVFTVPTSGDSEDSGAGRPVPGPLSPLPVTTADRPDTSGSGASAPIKSGIHDEALPPWLADSGAEPATDGPAPAVGEPVDERPSCPCGRSESLHSRGNWRTCPAGHRWHAFGYGRLERCPQCADGDPSGGDAA